MVFAVSRSGLARSWWPLIPSVKALSRGFSFLEWK